MANRKRNNELILHFLEDGWNYTVLALYYHVTNPRIRQIVKREIKHAVWRHNRLSQDPGEAIYVDPGNQQSMWANKERLIELYKNDQLCG